MVSDCVFNAAMMVFIGDFVDFIVASFPALLQHLFSILSHTSFALLFLRLFSFILRVLSSTGVSKATETVRSLSDQLFSSFKCMGIIFLNISSHSFVVLYCCLFDFVSHSLAASVLKCGQKKVWLDPNEVNEIKAANSRQNIR